MRKRIFLASSDDEYILLSMTNININHLFGYYKLWLYLSNNIAWQNDKKSIYSECFLSFDLEIYIHTGSKIAIYIATLLFLSLSFENIQEKRSLVDFAYVQYNK